MELNRNQNAIVWLILSMAMGVNALRNHISGNTPLLIIIGVISAICLAVFICQFTALTSKKWFKWSIMGVSCITIVALLFDFVSSFHSYY